MELLGLDISNPLDPWPTSSLRVRALCSSTGDVWECVLPAPPDALPDVPFRLRPVAEGVVSHVAAPLC